jgi:predicted Zn-dependent peptidase
MSVEQLEQQIQQLPPADLVRLAEWVNRLLASRTSAEVAAEPEWEETPELVAELERRLAEFRANPAIAVPFEPDYFENLKRQILDERAQILECRQPTA